MRKGFSYIELIFVIVVVGILATTALQKLFAVRDDAKLSTDIAQMATCIRDANMYYTSRGIDMPVGTSQACNNVKCFTITYGEEFVVEGNPTGADYCDRVNELGRHLIRTYRFHGSRISI